MIEDDVYEVRKRKEELTYGLQSILIIIVYNNFLSSSYSIIKSISINRKKRNCFSL
jgi:hypothetical protein